ncbi:hypothetical protein DLJ53_06520 [Acuticoccus sediminis]|uniref:Uncharacterized protein n=1 Tax=Acuticoccus sediminis TaxID=2184697 RepID=A0A8B2P6A4_9HYPH|nr:hypothetical protein [Acuticoccus sediminis]RAI04099.1 hypothetical protein DLJ53_06520 [Acuticoccus sediminis]
MDRVRVVSGDFAPGSPHRMALGSASVELRLALSGGRRRGRPRIVYGPSDIETIRRGGVMLQRRVGWALAVTLCLLPLGPLALVGLLALMSKQEWTIFRCTFKDGRSFIGEVPTADYQCLIGALNAWHMTQDVGADWLPDARRGSAVRPVHYLGPPERIAVPPGVPMVGALPMALPRAGGMATPPWVAANDTSSAAAGVDGEALEYGAEKPAPTPGDAPGQPSRPASAELPPAYELSPAHPASAEDPARSSPHHG